MRRLLLLSGLVIMSLTSCLNTKAGFLDSLHRKQEIYVSVTSQETNPLFDGQGPAAAGSTYTVPVAIDKISADTLANRKVYIYPGKSASKKNTYVIVLADVNAVTAEKNNLAKAKKGVVNDKPATERDIVFFFPDLKTEQEQAEAAYKQTKPFYFGAPLRYISRTSFLQAVSIPIKYRFKGKNYLDDLSSSFNAGVAYGIKRTYINARKLYFPDNDPIDKVSRLSLSGGGFIGLTPIGVNPANTENKVALTRNVFGLTYGLIGVIGYNTLNFGIAVGLDSPLGADGRKWIYREKPWLGIVVGIDFIK